MESNEERGCLIKFIIGLIVAFLMPWFDNVDGLGNATLVFFVSLFFSVILFRSIDIVREVLGGSTTWRLPWASFFLFLIPSIAGGSFVVYRIYESYQQSAGEGLGLWLFLLIVCLCGVGKFLEDGDDC